MGQGQSGESHQVSTEELRSELAHRFTQRCFNPLELYSFKDVFHSLADKQAHISYLKEDTISRFLEIPDILGVSSIIFQIVSYLGAFPFGQDAPIILGFEPMIMILVVMTERYKRVLQKGSKNRVKLLFRAMAVYDRKEAQQEEQLNLTKTEINIPKAPSNHITGFAVDEAMEYDEEDDDDDLALAALESVDAIDAFKHSDAPMAQSSIPSDNLKKLIMLLLLIAPLGVQESLARNSERLSGDQLDGLRSTANNILAAFVNVEKFPGVKIHAFTTVISTSLPFLFNGFNALFEHFLFSKNIDFTKRKESAAESAPPAVAPIIEQPLLQETGEILDLNVLSQLSFFIPGSSLFRRLRLLYSGGDAGFSMGSFETKVFNWRAPTILLVAGNRISDPPDNGQERAFSDTLAPKRFPDSSRSSRVVFGVYLSQPWHQTHKECFGDADTLLFQLSPVHEVFHASKINTDYASFTKPPIPHPGIAFGAPHPKPKATAGLAPHINLGAVSLVLDSSFEFGVFTHNYTSGGGAFHNSQIRKKDWQDRFEIESLEVWGCGGAHEAEEQRKCWEWEEKEAEARRRINIGKGDIEADRALLEMAGLIGGNRSGGSMN
ncbi:TLD-domain-containing protein [Calycina marina]|uniref:Restriction of telomere capping protein 5 n=1 Tax=Calycina marina TaxID=1763456 RepID=A0A9P7YXG2_9HELO|nr:TLD-domain-containing protein [Calycina marina]